MPQFEFTRVERVIAKWTVEAASIEEARDKWEEEHADVKCTGEEVTDVYDAWWEGEDGTHYGETAEDDEPLFGETEATAEHHT
jgi:hypothetical protein